MKNYYEVLALDSRATIEEIKKSYRTLALKYHPDRNNSPDASDQFIEISEAYEILSNSERRELYDSLMKSKEASTHINVNRFSDEVRKSRESAIRYSRMSLDKLLTIIGKVTETTVRTTLNLSTLLFSLTFFLCGFFGFFNWLSSVREGHLDTFGLITGPFITIGATLIGGFSLYSILKNGFDN